MGGGGGGGGGGGVVLLLLLLRLRLLLLLSVLFVAVVLTFCVFGSYGGQLTACKAEEGNYSLLRKKKSVYYIFTSCFPSQGSPSTRPIVI